MKKFFVAAIAACAVLTSCSTDQLNDLTTKTNQLASDVETIKSQIIDLQKLLAVSIVKYDAAIDSLFVKAEETEDSITVLKQMIDALEGKIVVTGFDYDPADSMYVVSYSDETVSRFHLDSFFKDVKYDGEYVTVTFVDNYVAQLKMVISPLQKVELVFVPEFSDGCATVYYYDEKEIDPMRIVVSFSGDEEYINAITAGVAEGSIKVFVGVMTSTLTRSVAQGTTLEIDPANITVKLNELIIRNIPAQTDNDMVSVILADGISALHTDNIPIKKTCTALEYEGVKYHTAKMLDGRWWMAENLRYVPEGLTASTDPMSTDGFWCPVDLTTTTLSNNAELIESQGYLYRADVAFKTSLNINTYDQLEGVQGICPDGWHIPTGAEAFALTGVIAGYPGSPTAAAPCDVNSVYYTGDATKYGSCPAANLNADSFNWNNVGYVNCTVDSTTGVVTKATVLNTMANILSSTAKAGSGKGDETHLTAGTYYTIGYNTKTGAANGMNVNFASGSAVRCIKNK